MSEQWRPVVGYEGRYEVSDAGRVRRVAGGKGAKTGRIMKLYQTVKGYCMLTLYGGDVKKRVYVHRLVLLAFVGRSPDGRNVCNHRNGNKADNRLENLEWCSQKHNIQHAINTLGHRPGNAGEKSGSAKLTNVDVREIRRLLTADLTKAEIARRFGVAPSTIRNIATGETWANLK